MNCNKEHFVSEKNEPLFNSEQQKVYGPVCDHLDNNIVVPLGTGMTSLTNLVLEKVRV